MLLYTTWGCYNKYGVGKWDVSEAKANRLPVATRTLPGEDGFLTKGPWCPSTRNFAFLSRADRMRRVLDLFRNFRQTPHLRFEHGICLQLREDEWIYVNEGGTGCGMRHPANSQCGSASTPPPPGGCRGSTTG